MNVLKHPQFLPANSWKKLKLFAPSSEALFHSIFVTNLLVNPQQIQKVLGSWKVERHSSSSAAKTPESCQTLSPQKETSQQKLRLLKLLLRPDLIWITTAQKVLHFLLFHDIQKKNLTYKKIN